MKVLGLTNALFLNSQDLAMSEVLFERKSSEKYWCSKISLNLIKLRKQWLLKSCSLLHFAYCKFLPEPLHISMRAVHISSLVRTLLYFKHQKTFRLNYAADNISVKCVIVVFSILKLGDLCVMSLLSISQSLIKKQNFLYTLINRLLSLSHIHTHTPHTHVDAL